MFLRFSTADNASDLASSTAANATFAAFVVNVVVAGAFAATTTATADTATGRRPSSPVMDRRIIVDFSNKTRRL